MPCLCSNSQKIETRYSKEIQNLEGPFCINYKNIYKFEGQNNNYEKVEGDCGPP